VRRPTIETPLRERRFRVVAGCTVPATRWKSRISSRGVSYGSPWCAPKPRRVGSTRGRVRVSVLRGWPRANADSVNRPYQVVEKRDPPCCASSFVIAAYWSYASFLTIRPRRRRGLHLIVFQQPARNTVYQRAAPLPAAWKRGVGSEPIRRRAVVVP